MASQPLAGAPSRTPKRKHDISDSPEVCLDCGATKTPLWRWDPSYEYGERRLCNKCGCKAARLARKHGSHKRHTREIPEPEEDHAWEEDQEDGDSPSCSNDGNDAQDLAWQSLNVGPNDPNNRRQRRARRPEIRDESDAWVTVEAVPRAKDRRGSLTRRPSGKQPGTRIQKPINTTVRFESLPGRDSLAEYVSYRDLTHPRKQPSPQRAL